MTWQENILQAHKHSKMPVYKLYRGVNATGNTLSASDEGATFEDSHVKLQQYLLLPQLPGVYLIQFKSGLKEIKEILDHRFEVPYGYQTPTQQNAGIGNVGGYVPGMLSEAKVAEMIADAKKGWERDRQLDELIKKMTEQTAEIGKLKKKADPLSDALEAFKPYMPVIMHAIGAKTGYNGPQVGIAGIGAAAVPPMYERTGQVEQNTPAADPPQLTPEQLEQHQLNRQRLNEVLTWLMQVEGGETEAVNFLYKLMEKGIANPEQMAMLKSIL